MKNNTLFTSYAQNFEDFMLWRALKKVHKGFYIDVGACDPIHGSITKSFYDRGWSGINIEPIVQYHVRLSAERPRDANLNVLASDKNGKTVFYENDETGLSSCLEVHTKSWHEENPDYKFKKVYKVAKTLDSVCAENSVKEVHFLKIDVEGFEINVLHGFSFDVIRPWIVMFEAVAPTGDHEDISSECVSYLQSKKYHQVFFDGLNKFFVSDEHAELDNAFLAPMNIFDQPHLRLYDYHWLVRDKVSEIESIVKKGKEDNGPSVADEAKSQLSEVYNSHGWRIVSFINRSVRTIVPPGSARRKTVKSFLGLYKQSTSMLRGIPRTSKGKIKHYYAVSTGKLSRLISLMGGVRSDKKINLKALQQLRFADTQWGYALDLLSELHDDNGLTFEGALEDSFYFGESERITPETKNWIAISHQPPVILAEMIKKGKIQKCLRNCKGIFTLSKYCRDELKRYLPGVKIESLYHPCSARSDKFDTNLFLKNKQIRFLGKWLRKYDIFDRLNSPYKKIDGREKNYLSPKEYNLSFTKMIMFIDVKDASAMNGVIECIMRNTPLLICKHPAVVEYLGESYPFYYQSLGDANAKINDIKLIIKTHEYLKNMDKTHIEGKAFLDSFVKSEIYKSL